MPCTEVLAEIHGASVPPTALRLFCSYAAAHSESMRSLGRRPLSGHRFLVAEAGNWGLGNRLYALVSCLALALLMNRTLLVRDWFVFPSRWEHLFAPPPPLPSWGELSYEEATARLLPSLPAGWRELEAASGVVSFVERHAQLHVVDGVQRRALSDHLPLLCSNLTAQYSQPFLHVLSNANLLPLLRRNRHAAGRLAAGRLASSRCTFIRKR